MELLSAKEGPDATVSPHRTPSARQRNCSVRSLMAARPYPAQLRLAREPGADTPTLLLVELAGGPRPVRDVLTSVDGVMDVVHVSSLAGALSCLPTRPVSAVLI